MKDILQKGETNIRTHIKNHRNSFPVDQLFTDDHENIRRLLDTLPPYENTTFNKIHRFRELKPEESPIIIVEKVKQNKEEK